MDNVPQQNATMVEESSAASQGLAGQSNELEILVSRFRLSGDGNVRALHPRTTMASHGYRQAV